jgi:hypothetical protein
MTSCSPINYSMHESNGTTWSRTFNKVFDIFSSEEILCTVEVIICNLLWDLVYIIFAT